MRPNASNTAGFYSIVLFVFGCNDISARTTITTHLSAPRVVLPCAYRGPGTAVWSEVIGLTTAGLYSYFGSGQPQDDRNSSAKYTNFNAEYDGSSFSLIITDVEMEDGGTYRCAVASPDPDEHGDTDYELNVEVPGAVAITSGGSDVSVGQIHPLTCQATGARSANELTLTWTPAAGGITEVTNPTSDGSTLLDYTSTLQYEPQKDHTDITCTLEGFESEIPQEEITSTVTVNVRYRPECTLEASPDADDCTKVTLACSCDAKPDVQRYKFYKNSAEFNQTTESSVAITVDMDQETMLACQASNIIDGDSGFGEMAILEESYTCRSSTIDDPTATSITTAGTSTTANPEKPSEKDPNEEPGCNTGLIIGVAVAALVVLVAVNILVGYRYFMMRERDQLKGNDQRSNVISLEKTRADNSAYMDLEERVKTEKGSDSLGGIPEANVEFVSDFPSRGFLVYRRVNIIRNSRREDAVAKSLSDDVSIAFLKLWNAEIKSVLNLPKQQNIVSIIGWCNAVPYFLLTELVTGENLLQHLSDNFSPHKLHQYGNIKKKRFQVPEKGNRDILPRYAVDVSRGLQFSLANKFIHPGLRAEKVLVDSTGRCKLYDIVSIERAGELTSLLWRDSAPYPWMPPEYLLLGTLAPAGDVWSFGVLLWEIFSYGSQPYPGEDRDAVENSLRRSDRLKMPQNCPGAIWQLMIQCWEQSPERRPKLEEITSKLSTMCNENKEYEEIPNQRPIV